MKNKIYILSFLLFFCQPLVAEDLNIQASKIQIDKKTKSTIFENNVSATDTNNNIFKTNYAEYFKDLKLLKSKGETTLLTAEGYFVSGTNMIFDNINNTIKSKYPATIKDLDNNKIYLEQFEYSTKNNLFKSVGKIQFKDSNNNSYNFAQIYIDEKKREVIGSDIKAFLNQKSFKFNEKNKPRVFANTVKIDDKETEFTKSVFTLCDYREGDKCPPWSLQASNMKHNKENKTIYYDNAVIKIYDIPIFYTPKLSHPDPTVDRRSGFLPPTFSDSKNLGSGLQMPYFVALDDDKDFTFSPKVFVDEHPLFLGEYRQAFKKSNLILDFGYTKGYKNTSNTKSSGSKSHFFSKFVKDFAGTDNSKSNLEITFQETSHDKYLKLYKIKSNLVSSEIDTLEKSINFFHEKDDLFLGLEASLYETLKEDYNDKYEYILPDIVLDKNLLASDEYGNFDLRSNIKVHNYDTNKYNKFFVNDIDWKYKNINFSNINSKLIGKLKNVNYETKNTPIYKDKTTSEFFGAVGYILDIDLIKSAENKTKHFLKPKALFRYAPGNMRKEDNKTKLNPRNIFSLDRLNSYDNFESGLSTTLGFEYKLLNSQKELNFSVGQVINEKENKNMPASSSLDQKFSDVVAHTDLKINENLELNYNFALDQNYHQFNYNELNTKILLNPVNLNFSYVQEKEHIGNQEYFKTNIELKKSQNALFSAETKRNLITDSAEYYNLSYEYLNDCLKAGIVYRREFYNDSELEPENSLMFKITLTPFGNINSPSFN